MIPSSGVSGIYAIFLCLKYLVQGMLGARYNEKCLWMECLVHGMVCMLIKCMNVWCCNFLMNDAVPNDINHHPTYVYYNMDI